jgi:DNA-binding response OmpR family regulator
VTSASDGLEAVEHIADPTKHFDAVLLDLNMPGASGLDVLKAIRATRPELPVLIVSGHITAETRTEMERLGQREFMSKPYTLDELGRRLRVLFPSV